MKSKYKLLLILIYFICSHSNSAFAGTERQGGGDALLCKKDIQSGNDYEGLYSLDYFLTVDKSTSSLLYTNANTWEESIQRIHNRLLKLFPNLGKHFGEFIELLDNHTDL